MLAKKGKTVNWGKLTSHTSSMCEPIFTGSYILEKTIATAAISLMRKSKAD